jgi:hypothetical protein
VNVCVLWQLRLAIPSFAPEALTLSANQHAYDDSIFLARREADACAEGRRPHLPGSFLLPPIPDDLDSAS